MKNALVIFLTAVLGLGLAGQAAAGFRISGLHCVRSRPDQEPHSQAASPPASGQTSTPGGAAAAQGYVLSGTVRCAAGLLPVRRARIEVWQPGATGQYDNAPRITVWSEESGKYRLEGVCPSRDPSGAPPVCLRVSAPGFKTLVTEYHPGAGPAAADFDLVLAPTGKEHDKVVKR
jgi:protocatechuate 3,4-dioxygenase beta subunit